MAEVYEERRPRKRWGRRLLITFLVLLIFVAIILAVVDRIGASYAERVIADRVAQEVTDQQATSDRPDVSVEGVPFLTQVLRGNYQEIHIQLRNFSGPAGGADSPAIRMPLLDVRAQDVAAPLDTLRTGQGEITAARVDGSGTIGYDTLAQLSEQENVTLGERDGKMTVSAPLTALSQTVTVTGTANLEVTDQNLVRVRFDEVTADGLPDIPIVQTLLTNYARQISVDLQVPPLPLGLQVESVQPTPAGLVVTVHAENVPLSGAGI